MTTIKRSPAAPEVPTLDESGIKGYDYSTWYGLLAPGRVPKAMVDRLNSATHQVLDRNDIRQKFEQQGVDAVRNSPAEFAEYLRTETEKWGKVVKATGAKAE